VDLSVATCQNTAEIHESANVTHEMDNNVINTIENNH